jgi:sugar/nucleoside kinase (ribokinase family)
MQVNLNEFELLSGMDYSRQNARSFVAKSLNHLKCLAVTCGARGSAIFYKGDGNIIARNIPPIKIRKVYDTTGCGDIFGAGFIAEYLRSGSLIKAAGNGNRLAAARCRLKGEMF